MAEGPKITRSDDGLYVRYEFDVHYISDEDAQRIRGYIDQLQAENAKLRELVTDMWPHVRHRSRMCGECELPCDTSDECLLYEPMRQRLRELRIEVDE